MNQDVMKYDGTIVPITELKKDDELLGLNGKPVKVIKIEKSNQDLFEIVQKQGDPFVATYTHPLVLKFTSVQGIFWNDKRKQYKARYIRNLKVIDAAFTMSAKKRGMSEKAQEKFKKELFDEATEFLEDMKKKDGYCKGGDILVISLRDYLELPKNVKRILYCFKQQVEYIKNDIDLDAYMLGAWLGDGTSSKPEITNIDKELIEYIKKYAVDNSLKITISPSKKITYRYAGSDKEHPNVLWNQLKSNNLVNNKHIPQKYLLSDRKTRLQVLAGLLDTDGYLYNNTYEITQKNTVLANNIVTLSRSLGFRTSITKVTKDCVKPNGTRISGIYNRTNISGVGLEEIPTLLPRKKAKIATKGTDFLISQFTVTEIKDKKESIKIWLSNSDGLFFGKDFTVMHDSSPIAKK